ncbi:PQQ-binding-like beta-propeller repeat protein [Mycolicibacterium peregrinum]|uniref:PQQ-binding-like beta-propeller repeat protein n=1 Tax=Mycolicibacterium peregrinum TaxID=43304 RepID=UPI0010422509|nr:PQQ-binding-like beta-propeller repeat protein [Mycolicibacterium peregrinum]
MSQWGSSPWGDNDGQPGSSPFGPPVFGAAPGFASQPPGYGYPPQFTPRPPEEDRRRRAKLIGMIVAAVVVVAALVVGGVLAWTFGSGSQPLSEADTAAGRAEIAAEERPPGAVNAPTLTSAPTTPLWTYPPGENTLGLVHLLGGDAKTVIIILGNSLIALDAANGSPRWKQPVRNMLTGCVIGTSGQVALCTNGAEAILIDMATGLTKESKRAKGGPAEIYGGAGVLAANLQEEFTVFDDLGRQLWSKPLPPTASVFLDQGIVAGAAGTTTTFYDAKTGDQLFAVDETYSLPIATSRGIAVSVRPDGLDTRSGSQIDFYSFTGKLAWRITADRGYQLPSSTETGSANPDSATWAKWGLPSGVTSLIVYHGEKNEIAGVDVLTGELTWTQQISLRAKEKVSLRGFGNLCVVSKAGPAGGMRVRDCSDGTGAFLDRSKIIRLIAANRNQILGLGYADSASRSRWGPVTAFDSATGLPLWQLPIEMGAINWVGDGLYSSWTSPPYGIQRLA